MRLSQAEEDLAVECMALAARISGASALLHHLGRLHVEMAARIAGPSHTLSHPLAHARLPREWAFAGAGLAGLRDRELLLARAYSQIDPELAHEAWDRYRTAERLVALEEFDELAAD
jgi:hypothetical protein